MSLQPETSRSLRGSGRPRGHPRLLPVARRPPDQRFAAPACLSSAGRKDFRVAPTIPPPGFNLLGCPQRRRSQVKGCQRPAATTKFRAVCGVGATRCWEVELRRMRVFIISDMEGVAGITTWEQVDGGDPHVRRGAASSTPRRSTPPCAARFAAGATEVVVMDCHGAGNGWSFNSLLPDQLDPRCEFVVQREWTEYTESWSRAATRRSSSACTPGPARRTAVINHTVSGTHWRTVGFNGARGRRGRHQRRALRHVGLPGAARDRRRGRVPRGPELLGDGLDDRGGQAEPRPVQRPPQDADRRPHDDRGRRARGRSPTSRRSRHTTRPAVRDRGRARQLRPRRAVPPPPRRRDRATARTIVARATTGGRPGAVYFHSHVWPE